MKFQVPQFIDVEDQIFYSLSFKEFIYMTGGTGLSYVIYHFINPWYIAIVFALPVFIFFALLSFYKPNNRPFIEQVEAALRYFITSKLYIWKKENKPLQTKEVDMSFTQGMNIPIPTMSQSKLKDINWSLDTSGVTPEAKKSLNNSLNIKI